MDVIRTPCLLVKFVRGELGRETAKRSIIFRKIILIGGTWRENTWPHPMWIQQLLMLAPAFIP